MDQQLSEEGIRAMSDNELSETLVSLGLARTPVTYTTRPWLEKKLMERVCWKDDKHLRINEIDEKKQQTLNDEINNSINELISSNQSAEPAEQQEESKNKLFYAVSCPEDNTEDDFSAESRVFNLQEDALKFAKKNKKCRFKSFRIYEEALQFATTPATIQISAPMVSSPGYVDGASRFKGPKSQDLVQLRKEIENGNTNMVRRMIWENPRYLISNGDMPSILQEGARYNALHVAARKGNAEMAALILETLSDTKFALLLYGDCVDNGRLRCSILLDLFLNMPDKGLHETPLHIASKLGAVRCVEVLVNYPECKKNQLNKEKLTPVEIICTRQNPHASATQEIKHLLQDTFFVPVLRSSTLDQPEVGEPFSSNTPLVTTFEVSAYAGPMDFEHAKVFHKQLKYPSRRVKMPFSTARLSDFNRGLEREGRDLARMHNVKWKEFWPFLGFYIDLACLEGLTALEDYFKTKFNEQPISNGDALSPMTELCDSLRSVSISDRQFVDRTPPSRSIRRPPTDPPRIPELTHNPLLYIEKTCQVLARRLADGLTHKFDKDRRTLKTFLHVEISNMQNIVLSFRSENQFTTSVDYSRVHSRIAALAKTYLKGQMSHDELKVLVASLQGIVTSDLDLSSDEEQDNTSERSSMMREQMQCLGRMLVRSSTEVPQCDNVEWMWAQCQSCCCSWILANMRSPRVRGSSLKRAANMHKQQQDATPQTPTSTKSNHWRQPPKEFTDSDDSSDDESKDEFFTPPSSLPVSDDEEEFEPAEEGRMVFISGSDPTKLDIDVLRACESHLLSPKKFPFVWRWRHQILTFPERERQNWKNPHVSQRPAMNPTMTSPLSPVRSPVSSRKVLPQSWASPEPPFSPPCRRLNL
ncbi:ankyrin repeat and LEM domain-containing protein 2 homolog [Neocloeon triangulifer]|uniref:ankyrin repeat and LEM domain-containing protein 2 homolog n=1 Tax=Neocloeon triangulifer TaxID=2078957 RepID=UPI00286F1608|nr:ankyrin repeat and LEM domain-containing protein 2 homolog [Neocloeon triangulifer]